MTSADHCHSTIVDTLLNLNPAQLVLYTNTQLWRASFESTQQTKRSTISHKTTSIDPIPHLTSQRSTKTTPSTSYLALPLHGAKTTWSLSAQPPDISNVNGYIKPFDCYKSPRHRHHHSMEQV